MVFGMWKRSKLTAPRSDRSFAPFLNEVMVGVQKRALKEQDFYWFLIEVYDFLSDLEGTFEILSAFHLYELEYKGEKSENSYPKKRNEASRFFREDVMGALTQIYSTGDANRLLALTYILMVAQNFDAVKLIRVKYAVHYHNNCVKSGSLGYANRWRQVIDDAENQSIRLPPFEKILPWKA